MTGHRLPSIRVFGVLLAAKAAGLLSRLLGRGSGEAVPGRLTEVLHPRLPSVLAQQFSHGIIIVTGTNGKTSTTKMLDEMLTRAGERVVSNRGGSNMKQGIVSAIISSTNVFGRLRGKPTIGLFEVDEATVPLIIQAIGARHLLITNLFRDQLDRFGEIDAIATVLANAVEGSEVILHLNADDPLVASLGGVVEPGQVRYFGMDSPGAGSSVLTTAADSVHCPRCGTKLEFQRTFYSHLGHYHCPRGDFIRPPATVAVSDVVLAQAGGSSFALQTPDGRYEASMPLGGGLYNIYNATAALAVALDVGVPVATTLQSLAIAKPAFGRLEDILWNGRRLQLTLVKNPAGFTQVLDTSLRPHRQVSILIAVNDADADGRDVSWLWDIPFECLAGRGHRIVVAGTRADDMALRLHYADIPFTTVPQVLEALDELLRLTAEDSPAYIFATYTAMLSIRRQVGRFVDLVPIGKC